MNISSTSLFHFTPKFENLKGILTNGFRFSEVTEELPVKGYTSCIFDQLGVVQHVKYTKTVCFCDLPLSTSVEHRAQYGHYIVGMKKEWGMANEVTPVRYVHENSPGINSDRFMLNLDMPVHLQRYGNSIFHFMANLLRETDKNEVPSDSDLNALPEPMKRLLAAVNAEYLDLLRHGFGSVSFIRSHAGDWQDRATQEISYRTFYDEREWRAVSDLNGENYLAFKFADVNHLIVNTEEEAEELGAFLGQMLDALEISSITKVWRKIKVASELLSDI